MKPSHSFFFKSWYIKLAYSMFYTLIKHGFLTSQSARRVHQVSSKYNNESCFKTSHLDGGGFLSNGRSSRQFGGSMGYGR